MSIDLQKKRQSVFNDISAMPGIKKGENCFSPFGNNYLSLKICIGQLNRQPSLSSFSDSHHLRRLF